MNWLCINMSSVPRSLCSVTNNPVFYFNVTSATAQLTALQRELLHALSPEFRTLQNAM